MTGEFISDTYVKFLVMIFDTKQKKIKTSLKMKKKLKYVACIKKT